MRICVCAIILLRLNESRYPISLLSAALVALRLRELGSNDNKNDVSGAAVDESGKNNRGDGGTKTNEVRIRLSLCCIFQKLTLYIA